MQCNVGNPHYLSPMLIMNSQFFEGKNFHHNGWIANIIAPSLVHYNK